MENLKSILAKHNLTLKKVFGQNFLTDRALLDSIVESAGVTETDTVLEIGCGAGALTTSLSKKAKRVVGYEIDLRLKPVLADVLYDCKNVEIEFSDVLKTSVKDIEDRLKGDYIIVANLPYYITTPIIMRFLENAKHLKRMVIMVQKEVADRLVAKENSTDYGAISVGINLRGSAEKVLYVPREKFTPPPNVDSAVVRIDIQQNKYDGANYDWVREVVRCAFSSRRKMLVNNLINTFKLSRTQVEEILTEAEIPLTVRGENLSSDDYVRLAEVIFGKKGDSWKGKN